MRLVYASFTFYNIHKSRFFLHLFIYKERVSLRERKERGRGGGKASDWSTPNMT